MPLPHEGAQSTSTVKLAPFGQQPSPARGAVMGSSTHAAAQVPALTRRASVQGLALVHRVGHAPGRPAGIAVSQTSPRVGSRVPLPQVGEQSPSMASVHPDGQQPSPDVHALIGVTAQRAEQLSASPTSVVRRHLDGEGGQAVGQAPNPAAAGSQASPGSSCPLPHR
jgi:hypothetical protein